MKSLFITSNFNGGGGEKFILFSFYVNLFPHIKRKRLVPKAKQVEDIWGAFFLWFEALWERSNFLSNSDKRCAKRQSVEKMADFLEAKRTCPYP